MEPRCLNRTNFSGRPIGRSADKRPGRNQARLGGREILALRGAVSRETRMPSAGVDQARSCRPDTRGSIGAVGAGRFMLRSGAARNRRWSRRHLSIWRPARRAVPAANAGGPPARRIRTTRGTVQDRSACSQHSRRARTGLRGHPVPHLAEFDPGQPKVIAHLFRAHVVHDPQGTRAGNHRRHIAVKAGAVAETVMLHMVEPCLGPPELIEMVPHPAFILSAVDQALFNREFDVPAQFEVRRRPLPGWPCLNTSSPPLLWPTTS